MNLGNNQDHPVHPIKATGLDPDSTWPLKGPWCFSVPQLAGFPCGCSIWPMWVAEVMPMEKHNWDLSAQFGFDTNIRVFKGMFLPWATAESPTPVSIRWLTKTIFCYIQAHKVALNRKFQLLCMLNPAGFLICLKAKVQVCQTNHSLGTGESPLWST